MMGSRPPPGGGQADHSDLDLLEDVRPPETPPFPGVRDLLLGRIDRDVETEAVVEALMPRVRALIEDALRRGDGVLCVPLSREDSAARGLGLRASACGVCAEGTFSGDLESMRNARVSLLRCGPEDPHGADVICSGNIVADRLQGDCEMTLPDEQGRYAGAFLDGVPSGRGTFFAADGSWYEGQWSAGMRHGHGVQSFAGGASYAGQWQNDAYHGQGDVSARGGRYAGTWAHGVRVGRGVLTQTVTAPRRYEIGYDDAGEACTRAAAEEAEIARLKASLAEAEEEAAGREESPAEASPRSCGLCKVCFEHPVSRVMQPCKHACVCEACCQRMEERVPASFVPPPSSSFSSRLARRLRCPVCRAACRSEEIILS